MTSIIRATTGDYSAISEIGRVAVEESHRGSCTQAEMDDFLERNYNQVTIQEELADVNNIYHVINYNSAPTGFSKIVLNAKHPNVAVENAPSLTEYTC
jgi:hypothetical protein